MIQLIIILLIVQLIMIMMMHIIVAPLARATTPRLAPPTLRKGTNRVKHQWACHQVAPRGLKGGFRRLQVPNPPNIIT